jgi:hypothetical protein
MAAGIVLGAVLVSYAFYTSGCGGTGTVSGPTNPTTGAPAPVASVATPVPSTPTVVQPPGEGGGVTVTFGNNASWDVANNNGFTSEFWAYWTDFDNQDLARDVKHAIIQNGDHFIDTFDRGCLQLDITQYGPGGLPIAAAYYDQNGKRVSRINDEIRTACNARPCVEPRETPTTPGAYSWNYETLDGQCEQEVLPVVIDAIAPALNCHQTGTQKWAIDYTCQADGERVVDLCRNVACPTPPPCEPTFTTRTTTTYSDYGACAIVNGISQKSRTKTVKTYTQNSCTEAEELTDTVTTTGYDRCELTFCHVAANGTPDTANDFGAISIQTTTFNYLYPEGNPGHNNHLTPSDQNGLPNNGQCPQDFWAINGQVCNNATAFAEILGIQGYQQGQQTRYRFYCAVN